MKLLPKFIYLLTLVITTLPAYALTTDQQPRHLTILTSYPPEFYQPFIKRYKALHPAVQIQVLNKKTTAAVEEIEKGNTRKFDLFWSSSLDAFGILKKTGKLQYSGYKMSDRTLAIGDTPLHDPEGYFYSFALSSVGFMWNTHFLEENALPVPTSWLSLSDPVYYGHLAMSTPSRSGTTHLIVESILQSMGWQGGWAYLLRTSGNLATVTARSFSVPEGIISGRFGIGFVIDFLAQGQKSIHANINFLYAEPTLLMPAGIGLLRNGENGDEAVTFIDFLLSPDGQKLLLEPTINRLPVIADLYTPSGPSPPELISLIQQGKTRPYDTELSRIRYNLVNTLFDQLITYRLLERRRIWKKLIELEQLRPADQEMFDTVKKAVVSLVSAVPVSEEESSNQAFSALFSVTAETALKSEHDRQQLQAWDDFVTENFRQAQALLDNAWQKMSGQQQ